MKGTGSSAVRSNQQKIPPGVLIHPGFQGSSYNPEEQQQYRAYMLYSHVVTLSFYGLLLPAP